MTQVALLKKAEIPINELIQQNIRNLGYDFKILNGLEKQMDNNGLECTINGHETYFETYVNSVDKFLNDADWVKPDVTDQDTVISFIWGADFAAGACIVLISIALMDYCHALIYYMDDEIKYSRDMLVEGIPEFLDGMEYQSNGNNQNFSKLILHNSLSKKSFLEKLKQMFK